MTRNGKSKPVSKGVKKAIKKAINSNVETKNIAITSNILAGGVGTGYAGSFISLSPIAQGDNINDRTGNVVRPVKIKISVCPTMTAASVATVLRVMVVRFKQMPAATLPAVTTVLAVTGSDQGVISPLNTASSSNGLFDVLKDKTLTLGVNNEPRKILNMTLTKSINKRSIHFNGANAADYGKGFLFLLLISDQAPGAGASPYTNVGAQMWYKDA